MEMANRMKELTQNIQASAEERAEELNKIKEVTNRLKRELAQSNTDRRKRVMQSRKNTQSLIQGFHDSRLESGEQLRKELAQGRKRLVQSGEQLRKDLAQDEKKRKQEVGKMLDAFQGSRQETGAELRKDLAEGKAKRKLEVKETLTDARTLINGYQSSRQTMGAELKNDLGKDRAEMKADVEDMRNGFRKAQTKVQAELKKDLAEGKAKTKADVEGMRQGFRKDREEVQADLKGAADAWKEMGSAMRNKTSGGNGKTAPGVLAEMPVELIPNLEEKALSIINQHAGGITLSEVAKELGLVTIVLGKAAKVLLEQGKVRREEKIYFPVTT